MAVETLIRTEATTVATIIEQADEPVAPLYAKGCKITRGAFKKLPAPSLRTALLLVQARRASSRILQPIAATRLQRAWVRHQEARREAAAAHATKRALAVSALQRAWRRHAAEAGAATKIETSWRRHAARAAYATQRRAALRLASAARGVAQRRAFRRQLADVSAPLAIIQAAVRAWLARRQLKAARAAARAIQSTWRRVRCEVLRRRLAQAAEALKHGGRLAKYRKGGKHERHLRYAWVSDDLQHLMWAPTVDRFDANASKLRSIPMASITAVSEGVKTPLLKKMERRAERAAEPHKSVLFLPQLKKPLTLDESCAFSIICRERVVDFYADDQKGRDRWLRDLKTALSYAHTYDHKAAMAAVEKLSLEAHADAAAGALASEQAKRSDSDTDDE